ncbi:hypothetical protein H4I95_07128 [Botrytis cinerea]
MSTQPLSPIRKAWYQWKALRLPWRKRFFVGLDLQNNSFWEFRDAINAGRMRRIVQTPSSIQYSDVRISPQWHQWLRHTREDAPSIEELVECESEFSGSASGEAAGVAGHAGERWRGVYGNGSEGDGKGVANAIASEAQEVEKEKVVATGNSASGEIQYDAAIQPREEKTYKDDPWKKARGGPSEEWQPQAWDPNEMPAARR